MAQWELRNMRPKEVMRMCLLSLTARQPQKVCVSAVVTCRLPCDEVLVGNWDFCGAALSWRSIAAQPGPSAAWACSRCRWLGSGCSEKPEEMRFSPADLTLGNDTSCFSLIAWLQAWLRFGFLLPHFYPAEARSPRNCLNPGAWDLAKLSLSSC